MTCETKMNLDVNNIVRTVLVAAVVAPISFSLSGLLGTQNEVNRQSLDTSPNAEVIDQLKADMELPCIRYATSKTDSKGEREAKNEIDELLGVDVAQYGQACNFVLGR